MYPYLRLGPFLLQLSALALILGVWIGSFLVEKEASRFKTVPRPAEQPDLSWTGGWRYRSAPCLRCTLPGRVPGRSSEPVFVNREHTCGY
jgi:hypothetical protein